MYQVTKTTLTPNYYTKHWSLKKGPSNKPKNPTKSKYKGETMPNHTLNTRPNTLLNLNSGLKGFRANANTILKKDSDTLYKSLSYTPLHLLE